MKVDFTGRYNQIAELLNSPLQRTSKKDSEGDFRTLLADISPDLDGRSNEVVQQGISNIPSTPADQGEMKASFRFPPPQLLEPTLEQIEPVVVNDGIEGSVKTPTVVSVTRISANPTLQHERISSVKKLVEQAGRQFDIDPHLSLAMVNRESSFNSRAVSTDGHYSKGLFQLLDRTGMDQLNRLGLNKPYNPFDAEQNVYLGVGYLRYLHNLFSQETLLPNNKSTVVAANSSSLEKLAVAAFNAGEGRVAAAQSRAKHDGKDPTLYEHVESYLPKSTREYVTNVIQSRSQYASHFQADKTTFQD